MVKINNKEVEEEHNKITEELTKEFGDKFKDGFKLKAVGYLDISEPAYECGEVPAGFIDKLKSLFHKGYIIGTMGHHDCEFCLNQGVEKLPREAQSSSDKILRDEQNKIDYKFPEMIFHYIKCHQFLPPNKFIEFVMMK